jgi:ATP-dependent DNA helicase RecQ
MPRRPIEILQNTFGHTNFRAVQQDVIDHTLSGHHSMLIAPTGSGKSLCYQIPALTYDAPADLTVVLSPLVALMKDQVDSLRAKGIDAAFVNSSLAANERHAHYQNLISNHHRLLYVTPERFRKPEFLESLATRNVRLLAVDEAHCVSQWGHDFRPDYSRLQEIRHLIGNPPTLFVTATATEDVRKDILSQAGIEPNTVRIFHEGIDRPNLSLEVTTVWDEGGKIELLQEVIQRWHAKGAGIVYVTLIKTLERISELLRNLGIEHVNYHGQLPREKRRKIQEEFLQDRCPLVLATNAFGMGIDKPDIRFVVHAETPSSIEAYYQEIGRAGRDGKASECHWLYNSDDLMTQMQFIGLRNPDVDFFHRTYHFLTEHNESVRAFGIEWLNERLQRVSRHDHRLETTLALLDRYEVISGATPPDCFEVLAPLPDDLVSHSRLASKLRSDQKRLYALVEFANAQPEDRQAFLRTYFRDTLEP